jgi:hypothetical protein
MTYPHPLRATVRGDLVRFTPTHGLAVLSAAALLLTACGDGDVVDEQTAPDELDGELSEEELEDIEDLLGDTGGLEDPNDLVEDGVFRGVGVVLPVPEGWSLDQTAYAQGVVAAISEDGTQQMSAQAVDGDTLAATGQDVDLELLLDNVRQLGPPDVDEAVELTGATEAHRLTYLQLPAQQEGLPDNSATIVLAEDDRGLIGEFTVSAASEDYDSELEDLLLEGAGFDPDSEPRTPEIPEP